MYGAASLMQSLTVWSKSTLKLLVSMVLLVAPKNKCSPDALMMHQLTLQSIASHQEEQDEDEGADEKDEMDTTNISRDSFR